MMPPDPSKKRVSFAFIFSAGFSMPLSSQKATICWIETERKGGMNPPWRSVSIQQIVAFWEDKGIEKPAEKMKANDTRFFEGSGGIIQAVVRGDVLIAELTDLPLNPLLEDGAPIGFVYPPSGTTLSANKAFVAAKAPHPNAGKVFLNWLMTEPGQTAL